MNVHQLLTQILPGKIPGMKHRPGQIKMALACEKAIQEKTKVLIEAPTGTGKTVSYLSAALATGAVPKRTIVVTHNNALLSQLLDKDLPLLREHSGVNFTFSGMKGIRNYLCLDSYKENLDRGYSDIDAEDTEAVLAWALTTQDGDKANLPINPASHVWNRFSTDRDGCLGSDCPSKKECFYYSARSKAVESTILVTNYHTLAAHAHLMQVSDGEVSLLPPADVLVCDELHAFADIARAFNGFEISVGRVLHVLAPAVAKQVIEDQKQVVKGLFQELKIHHGSSEYKTRFKEALPAHLKMSYLLNIVETAVHKYNKSINSIKDPYALLRAKKKATAMSSLAKDLGLALSGGLKGALYIEPKNDSAALCYQEVEVADMLSGTIWSEYNTVIGTSATLTAGGSFNFIREELGLQDAEGLRVESPFNYSKCGYTIVPEMPDPKSADYLSGLVDTTMDVINRAKGRTLCLFTSYMDMATVLRFKDEIQYPVLTQERDGGFSRQQLVEKFKEDIPSVLFGTESFWTGVDVPGEALSCLIISKIPFPRPDDPVLDVLMAQTGGGYEGWKKHCLPRAAIKLAQGAGRLIRTETDVGILVITDSRLFSSSYGKYLLNSLPPMPVVRDLNLIQSILP